MKKLKLKAHMGAEVSCVEGGRVTLLAASREGYQNLCRLSDANETADREGPGCNEAR